MHNFFGIEPRNFNKMRGFSFIANRYTRDMQLSGLCQPKIQES
jgi:hypothetical protein